MPSTVAATSNEVKPRFFYGWYIVAVGFIANVATSFALASTLSIFLKPLTADLGISRGVFSLLRSGEGIIAACLSPLVGALVDGGGRGNRRCGLLDPRPGCQLRAVRGGAPHSGELRRRFNGLHGGQRRGGPMVRAPARARLRVYQHGCRLRPGLHADPRSLAAARGGLAADLGGVRRAH